MTKNSNENSAACQKTNNVKSKISWKRKMIVILSLAVALYAGFKYLTYCESDALLEVPALEVSNEVSQVDEVENEGEEVKDDLKDLPDKEIAKKDAEFIYQALLKNQVQIAILKADVKDLRGEVLKYKKHNRIGKMILSYVKFREKAFAGNFSKKDFRSFEILSIRDKTLKALNAQLKKQLANFSSQEFLEEEFNNLVPELIAIRSHGDGDGFAVKLRRNISKLITIRRTDKIDNGDIDVATLKVENFLNIGEYQQSLKILKSLDVKYQNALQGFITKLQNRIDMEKTDAEILEYLEKLN